MMMVMLSSVSKKYGPVHNPHQKVTFCGCIGMELVWIGIVPNPEILLVDISVHPKMGSNRMPFLIKKLYH